MITVREARREDLEFLVQGNARMAQETEGRALNPIMLTAGVKAVLEDPAKGRYFIGEIDGAVAGMLMVTWEWSDWRNGRFWWVQSVYVRPECRRRGVFRALYGHVRELCRGSGGVGLRLYVERENETGKATYRAVGMSAAGYEVMEELVAGEARSQ